MTSSCATIFTGRKKITINTNIENAKKVDVDGNVYKTDLSHLLLKSKEVLINQLLKLKQMDTNHLYFILTKTLMQYLLLTNVIF